MHWPSQEKSDGEGISYTEQAGGDSLLSIYK